MIVYFDLETTGLNVNVDRIIQIGSASEDGKEFCTLVDTPRPISPKSEEITGITMELLKGQPTIREALLMWFEWLRNLGQEQIVLVAHNGKSFDFPLLQNEMKRTYLTLPSFARFHFVDSLPWARIHFMNECKSFSLANLFKYVCPDSQFQAHNALQDCLALRKVVEHKLQSKTFLIN